MRKPAPSKASMVKPLICGSVPSQAKVLFGSLGVPPPAKATPVPLFEIHSKLFSSEGNHNECRGWSKCNLHLIWEEWELNQKKLADEFDIVQAKVQKCETGGY
jgi:hypothetical protein